MELAKTRTGANLQTGSTSRVTFRRSWGSGRIAPWGVGKQHSCKSAAGVWNGKY